MNVNFYATLRPIVGGKTVQVEFTEGLSVRQLIHRVCDRFPLLRPELLDENGELHGHVHVFVNGRDVPFLPDKFDTPLAAEDMINIFPPVGGG